LPAEIPEHSPEFVIFVETDPVIDGIKMMCIVLEEDVAALTVGIVAEQVEKHNRFEELPVFIVETKVVVFGVVVNVLLERPRAIRAVVAKRGEWDDMKAKCLTDEVSSHFAPGQRVLREVPKRLLTPQGLIYGGIILSFVMDVDEKGVVGAKGELALDLIGATLDGIS